VKTAPPPILDNIPAELRAKPQWVTWRYEGRSEGEDETKIPYNARTGFRARTHDQPGKTYRGCAVDTWSCFDAAALAYQRGYTKSKAGEIGAYTGVGFIFTEGDEFAGLDLDHCANATTGGIEAWAMDYICLLDSYSEFSPSGTGVKIIVRACKPGPNCRTSRFSGFEFYDQKRLFTITGRRVPGTPATVNARQAEYAQAWSQIFPPTKAPERTEPLRSVGVAPSDDLDLLERIRRSANAEDFLSLYEYGNTSDYAGDDSAADLALCCRLAFWTQKDPARIDTLFRQSALYREKWERRDYRDRTIRKAIELTRDVYDPEHSRYKPPVDVASEHSAHVNDRAQPSDAAGPELPGEADGASPSIVEAGLAVDDAAATAAGSSQPAPRRLLDDLHYLDLKIREMGVKTPIGGLTIPPDMDREDLEKLGRLLDRGESYVQVWLNFRWGAFYNALPHARGVRGSILSRIFGGGNMLKYERHRLAELAYVEARIPLAARSLHRPWAFYKVAARMAPERRDFWMAEPPRAGMISEMETEIERQRCPLPQLSNSSNTLEAPEPVRPPSRDRGVTQGSVYINTDGTLSHSTATARPPRAPLVEGAVAEPGISCLTENTSITVDISLEMAQHLVALKARAGAMGLSPEAYLGAILQNAPVVEAAVFEANRDSVWIHTLTSTSSSTNFEVSDASEVESEAICSPLCTQHEAPAPAAVPLVEEPPAVAQAPVADLPPDDPFTPLFEALDRGELPTTPFSYGGLTFRNFAELLSWRRESYVKALSGRGVWDLGSLRRELEAAGDHWQATLPACNGCRVSDESDTLEELVWQAAPLNSDRCQSAPPTPETERCVRCRRHDAEPGERWCAACVELEQQNTARWKQTPARDPPP
jgi:hypothetical protein